MSRPAKYVADDGTRLPSVTELINELGWNKESLFRWADKLAREGKSPIMERDAAARRGTQVHALIDWVEDSDDELTQPSTSLDADRAYQAWYRWRVTQSIEPLLREQPMINTMLGYAGTPDLIGIVDDRVTVFDWKTATKHRPPYLEHIIQVTAYAQLWNAQEASIGGTRFATHGMLVKLAPDAEGNWSAKPSSWPLDAFGVVPTWIIQACLNLRRAREAMQRRASEVF